MVRWRGDRWGIHFAAEPTVVGGQRGVVEAPPLEVVEVPFFHGQMRCDFHPVPLRFKVAVHWGGCHT